MSKKREYQVKYSLRAVVGVMVRAESPEDAVEIANKRMNKNIFAAGVESLDEINHVIGYDDQDGWNVTMERKP